MCECSSSGNYLWGSNLQEKGATVTICFSTKYELVWEYQWRHPLTVSSDSCAFSLVIGDYQQQDHIYPKILTKPTDGQVIIIVKMSYLLYNAP